MTTKINQLARNCGATDCLGHRSVSIFSFTESELKEFSEALVTECAKVAVEKDSGYVYTAEQNGFVLAGRQQAARAIKQHFET